MLQAMEYKTSKFDKNLEDDFEGAEQTLVVSNISKSLTNNHVVRY